MKPHIAVTGGTGFVGRPTVRALQARGYRLRLFVRATGESKIPRTPQDVEIIETSDLFAERAEWWQTKLSGIDTVLHLAWYAEPGEYLSSIKNLSCLAGTMALAEGAIKASVRRFVGVGTCFEYALSDRHLSTATPLQPTSIYAATKAAAFVALSRALPATGVGFAWCRLFHLHGDGEDDRRLTGAIRSNLSRGIPVDLTSGAQIRDFLNVLQAGEKLADVVESNLGGPVNICSGVGISVRAWAESVADEYGRRDLLRFGKRPELNTDPPCVIGQPTDIASVGSEMSERPKT